MKKTSLGIAVLATLTLLSGSCGGGERTSGPVIATTGSLALTVTGLPLGTAASIAVGGPDGYASQATGSTTISGLAPGTYTLTAQGVTGGMDLYNPALASTTASVTAGASTPVTVGYNLASGRLAVAVTGLPGGTAASITVTGPGGYARSLTGPDTLTGLITGGYTVTATSVTAGADTWAPSPATKNYVVGAGTTPVSAVVSYARTTANLTVTISGLPAGTNGDVTVTGPNSFAQALGGTQTLTQLVPGSYTITAAPVTATAGTYTPTPASKTMALTAGQDAATSVAYIPPGGTTLNLSIPNAYLVQSIQRPNGSIPLVAGRDAWLRVFATANQTNSAAPSVRARFYQGGSLVRTDTIPTAQPSTPLAVQEGSLASSWNLLVPGSLIQPGLSVLVDVDPADDVAEADPNDNTWPSNGQPLAMDVRVMLPLNITFVKVFQNDGSSGNITSGNAAQFVADIQRMWPVGAISTAIGPSYSFTDSVLQFNDANGSWGKLLSELQAYRAGLTNPAYVYGVVHTNYSSGIAGLGYVATPASSFKTAVGWDYLPSGTGVFAHEIGHNFGRLHAPCGGVANPDPSFPYAGGDIGMYGMDVAAGILKSPSTQKDLMGYCSPVWVSDYNYMAVMNYRLASALGAPPAGPAVDGVLVWGRMTDDSLILEPAFRVQAPLQLPEGGGPYRLEGIGAGGGTAFSYAFEAPEVADLPGSQRHFAFVLPAAEAANLTAIRLHSPAGSVERTRPAGPQAMVSGPPPVAQAARAAAGRARLHWDAARSPVVLVRDAVTGAILSFARGGDATIATGSGRLTVQFSDGVTSEETTVQVR